MPISPIDDCTEEKAVDNYSIAEPTEEHIVVFLDNTIVERLEHTLAIPKDSNFEVLVYSLQVKCRSSLFYYLS